MSMSAGSIGTPSAVVHRFSGLLRSSGDGSSPSAVRRWYMKYSYPTIKFTTTPHPAPDDRPEARVHLVAVFQHASFPISEPFRLLGRLQNLFQQRAVHHPTNRIRIEPVTNNRRVRLPVPIHAFMTAMRTVFIRERDPLRDLLHKLIKITTTSPTHQMPLTNT